MSLFSTIIESDEPSSEGIEDQNNPETLQEITTPPERPDWLPERYKSPEDFAKAYTELEKRLGTAPNEYDFKAGEGWIDAEYEPFHEMAEFAKSKHVPQEVMDKMLSTVGKYLDEFKTDMAEERAKLGENAKERLEVLNNWAKANFSEEAFNGLTQNMRTADAIVALEEVRAKMIGNDTRIPTGNEDTTEGGLTLEAVQQELTDNIEKYKSDPVYRKQIQQKIASVSAHGDFVDKHY
jgi:hypothetical protein